MSRHGRPRESLRINLFRSLSDNIGVTDSLPEFGGGNGWIGPVGSCAIPAWLVSATKVDAIAIRLSARRRLRDPDPHLNRTNIIILERKACELAGGKSTGIDVDPV